MYYHPIDFDCFSLRSAMKGLGTDEDTLIEIIGTRPNSILKKIIERYSKLIEGRDLISDVKGDTSGSFRKLLVSILQTQRSGKLDPDIEKCNKILVLEKGKVVEQGTHDDLMKLGKKYFTLHKYSNAL